MIKSHKKRNEEIPTLTVELWVSQPHNPLKIQRSDQNSFCCVFNAKYVGVFLVKYKI